MNSRLYVYSCSVINMNRGQLMLIDCCNIPMETTVYLTVEVYSLKINYDLLSYT